MIATSAEIPAAERPAAEMPAAEMPAAEISAVEVEPTSQAVTHPPPENTQAAVRRLPPSERDANVYRVVVLEGLSTRDTAAAAGISQTRVRQIVASVVRWIAETLPPALADALPPAVALKMAQAIAAQRLDLMYSHTMAAWRKTSQPRYLGLALRVAAAQARLPVSPLLLECMLADAIDPDEESTPDVAARPAPLKEDCSPHAATAADRRKKRAAVSAASASQTATSKPLTPQQSASRREFLAGAGPLLTAGDGPTNGPPLSGLDLGEEELLRRLSRRRRKLQRAK